MHVSRVQTRTCYSFFSNKHDVLHFFVFHLSRMWATSVRVLCQDVRASLVQNIMSLRNKDESADVLVNGSKSDYNCIKKATRSQSP